MNKLFFIATFLLTAFNYAYSCPELSGTYESTVHNQSPFIIQIFQTQNSYNIKVTSKENKNISFEYSFDKFNRLQKKSYSQDGYQITRTTYNRCEFRDLVTDVVDCEMFEDEPNVNVIELKDGLKLCTLNEPITSRVSTLISTKTYTSNNPGAGDGWFQELTFAFDSNSNFIHIKTPEISAGNSPIVFRKID